MILHKNKIAITLDRDNMIPNIQLPIIMFEPKQYADCQTFCKRTKLHHKTEMPTTHYICHIC